MEVSAQRLALKPSAENLPNPNRLAPMAKAQLLDAQTQLETSCRDRHLTRMLKGVVTSMYCLMTLSREVGFIPYLGPAHYINACYLKNQITSNNPPSAFNLKSVWSCQADLVQDAPEACAWKFPHRCETWMRVALLIMPLDHLRSLQLGWERISCCDVYAGSIINH